MPLAVRLSCLGGAARAMLIVCLLCFSYLYSYHDVVTAIGSLVPITRAPMTVSAVFRRT